MNKHLAWRFRLEKEVLCSDLAFWLTLQYDDEHVPIDEDNVPYVNRKDCQRYFGKVRRYIKDHQIPVTCVHFLVSEYCPTTGRPHYHCLFLFRLTEEKNLQEKLLIRQSLYECLRNRWYHGFCYSKLFHSGVIKYLTEYVFKPFQNSQYKYPTFRLISNGIGTSFLDELDPAEVIQNNFRVPGCLYLPRYYRDKILPPEREGLKRISDYYWNRRFMLNTVQDEFTRKRVQKIQRFKSLDDFLKEQEIILRHQRTMSERKQKQKQQFKNF